MEQVYPITDGTRLHWGTLLLLPRAKRAWPLFDLAKCWSLLLPGKQLAASCSIFWNWLNGPLVPNKRVIFHWMLQANLSFLSICAGWSSLWSNLQAQRVHCCTAVFTLQSALMSRQSWADAMALGLQYFLNDTLWARQYRNGKICF